MKKVLAAIILFCTVIFAGCSLFDNNVGFKTKDTSSDTEQTTPTTPTTPGGGSNSGGGSNNTQTSADGLEDAYTTKLGDEEEGTPDLFAGMLITYGHDYNNPDDLNTVSQQNDVKNAIETTSRDILTRLVGRYGVGYIADDDGNTLVYPGFTEENVAIYNKILGTNFSVADSNMINQFASSNIMEMPVPDISALSGVIDVIAPTDGVVNIASSTTDDTTSVSVTVNVTGYTSPVVSLYRLPGMEVASTGVFNKTTEGTTVTYAYSYDKTDTDAVTAMRGVYRLEVSGTVDGTAQTDVYYLYVAQDKADLSTPLNYKSVDYDAMRYGYYLHDNNLVTLPWNWALDNSLYTLSCDCVDEHSADCSSYLVNYMNKYLESMKLNVAKVLRYGTVEGHDSATLDECAKYIDHVGLTEVDCTNLIEYILTEVIGEAADYDGATEWDKAYRESLELILSAVATNVGVEPIVNQLFIRDMTALTMSNDISAQDDESSDEDFEDYEDYDEDETDDSEEDEVNGYEFDSRFTMNIKSVVVIPNPKFYENVVSGQLVDGYIHVIYALLGTNPEGSESSISVAVKYNRKVGTSYVSTYYFPTPSTVINDGELLLFPAKEPFNQYAELKDGSMRTYTDTDGRNTEFESYGFRLQEQADVVYFHRDGTIWSVYKYENGNYTKSNELSAGLISSGNTFIYGGVRFTLRTEDNILLSELYTSVSDPTESTLPSDSTIAPGGMIADKDGYYPYLHTGFGYFRQSSLTVAADRSYYNEWISGNTALVGIDADFDYVELLFSYKQDSQFTISLASVEVA